MKDTDWPAYRDFIYPEQSRLRIVDSTREALLALHERYALFIISSGGMHDEKTLRKGKPHQIVPTISRLVEAIEQMPPV